MTREVPTMDACPSDELLAAFVERRLSGSQRAAVEGHVADCATCLDVVSACLAASPEGVVTAAETPAVLRDRPIPVARAWRHWAVAASVVLTAGASLFAMREQWTGPPMAPTIARLGARLLGLPLQARTVQFRLGSEPGTFVIALQDVVIGRVGRRYRADEVGMTLALAAPFTGEPSVQYVHVTHPTVDLVGRDPKDIMESRGERGKAIELLGQANRVDVEDAQVRLAGPDGTPLTVEGITGGIERTERGAKLAFHGHVADGDLDLVGTISGDERDVTLTIGGRSLDASELPLLRTGLRGTVDVRLDVQTGGGGVRADGRIAIRQGALLGRGPATLLHLSSESRAALTARDVALGGVDLPFEDARAIFAWRSGWWRLQRLYLATHGAIVGGRLELSSKGEVRGHGTLRLPAELVADLEPNEPALGRFHDVGGTATVPFVVTGTIRNPDVSLTKP
jgi:hypothetical protein